MVRKTVDWEAVELRYRAGTESLRSIAAAFGITEGAIRQRAKKENWSRDLEAKVRQATDAALLRKAATHNVRTEREAVAVEAEMRSDVVMRHRTDLSRGRALFVNLLTELEAAGAPVATPPLAARLQPAAKPVSMHTRIDSAKRLTEMLEKLVRMEREAFGLDKDDLDPEDPFTAMLRRVGTQAKTIGVVADDPDHKA